jgi:hypothetical protein
VSENQGANRQSSSRHRPRALEPGALRLGGAPRRAHPKWSDVKICFTLPDALCGGFHTFALNLSRQFAHDGHTVSAVISERGATDDGLGDVDELKQVMEVLGKLPGAGVVFIDSAHDFKTTQGEIKAYFEKLATPGFLVLHDSIRYPGVRQAVAESSRPKMTFATSRGAGVTVFPASVIVTRTVHHVSAWCMH